MTASPVTRLETPTDEKGQTFGALGALVGFAVRCTNQYLGEGLGPKLEAGGLKPHQFTALSLIVDNPSISQSSLARALKIKRSNIVSLVDEMEQRGLVLRKSVAGDRRSYALVASAKGTEVRDKALAIVADHENALLEFLSAEERSILLGLTSKIWERYTATEA